MEMAERGLTAYYVKLCIDAYVNHWLTKGRLAELLLTDAQEVESILDLFGYHQQDW
jgi:hypothetical protein